MAVVPSDDASDLALMAMAPCTICFPLISKMESNIVYGAKFMEKDF